MSTIAEQKRRFILVQAKKVFIEKGYAAVTMQDIIDKCDISRGGIYLYFSSVEEIYKEVIYIHNCEKLEQSRNYICEDKSFNEILDDYLYRQKQRILNMHDSLLMSMYEFRFAHKDNLNTDFFRQQFDNVKEIILEILQYGVEKGELYCEDVAETASHVVFFIEGLSMLGTAFAITEFEIDTQLYLLKNIILGK